ncbi:MAG: hypothetical protein LBV67_00285 [Streptococcaceae bacterium]|nr:hypothetical protein [Streptococcaceae bacterium]
MINIERLQRLPAKNNKYNVRLDVNEKVIFTTMLNTFGTLEDERLGASTAFTITNQKLVIDNGFGIWEIPLELVKKVEKVTDKLLFIPMRVYKMHFNEPVSFNEADGEEKKTIGFNLYVKMPSRKLFEELLEISV